MNVGIIDADLLRNAVNHRFPNLACMKLSSYHKQQSDNVKLLLNYDDLESYDKVYVSKVFSETPVPDGILDLPNVAGGGSGFYYDKAEPLPDYIEHIFPDYSLYDEWLVRQSLFKPVEENSTFKWFTQFSIGFLTRGCVRQCEFCVNRNSHASVRHSAIDEFFDKNRPYMCFLDDNFFACREWKTILHEDIYPHGKPFTFRQGLDFRFVDKEKIDEIATWKYYRDIIFAFDNIEDKERITKNLALVNQLYPKLSKKFSFYALFGFDRNNIYDDNFYKQDIINAFERCFILSSYGSLPYLMKYDKAKECKYSWIYSTMQSWVNLRKYYIASTFDEFCKIRIMDDEYHKYNHNLDDFLAAKNKIPYTYLEYTKFIENNPDIVKEYFYRHPFPKN